ncbi:hypothetical protein [Yersinia hibernica]|uniref:Uncharacterized protein n=1 Tax=Yersinia enterocolitica LC20 TaxID=1443113 RepID=A0A7U5PGK6_YEREN|nr:hypothetical protein [Yersinia hibernica]ATX62775.1 hypothetical protein LC20_07090 [Yersinia hibernica]OVZ75936.1 hypothetical protein CBW54_22095 [Yersinia kristensenii]
MPGSVNGAASQDIQANYAREIRCTACATGRPAFISLLTEAKNDPIALFLQQPHQTINAKELVYHETHKNLTLDFLNKKLSTEGDKIRTLIGVIHSDVENSGNVEDINALKTVSNKLAAAGGNEKKEQKVAAQLSALVSKYSAGAFEKVINQYIEHCMHAWEAHHEAKSVNVQDKVIFKQCLDVCKSTLQHDVEGLAQPNQPWETMAQKLNFFVHDCTAISKTLTFYDAEQVTPTPKGPEALNRKPEDGADNQRQFISTTPGQGGVTVNVNSKGGNVGDISHSVGAAATGPTDSNSAIVKHILDSGLTNVEKINLIKDLFKTNSGVEGHFLRNLASVQSFEPEQITAPRQVNVNNVTSEIETQTPKPDSQSSATQTAGVDETDTSNQTNIISVPTDQQKPIILVDQNELMTELDGGASKAQKTQNLEEDNLDKVDLRGNKTQTEPMFNEAGGKVVTLADRFAALKKRDPSVFDHLDKNGPVASQAETVKPTAEHDVGRILATSSMAVDGELQLNPRAGRKNGEQANRKSIADGFQPARFASTPTSDAKEKAVTKPVYTTERTVSLWNRETNPVSYLPPVSESDFDELGKIFSELKPRDQSVFDNLDNKKVEQPRVLLPFQEKLAEFKRRGGQ